MFETWSERRSAMAELIKKPRNVTERWQDWLNLLLAVWLFISPWVLAFYPAAAAQSVAASWDAWVVAVVVAVFSIAALTKAHPLEEWVNIIAGAWLFISPWVLGFYAGHEVAMWNALLVGAAVFVLAIWDLNTMPEVAGRST
jgi:phosphoglycerol transferase MdoB-like AlkP superfamily enzyme